MCVNPQVMAFNEGRLESLAVLQRSPALLAKMRGGLEASRGLFGRRNCGNANSVQIASHSSTTSGHSSAAAVFAAANAAAGAAASLASAASNAASSSAGIGGMMSTSSARDSPAASGFAASGGAFSPGTGGGGGGGHHHSASVPPGLGAGVGVFGVATEGPVRCIFLRGGRAWTSGGRGSTGGWLQLWDAHSFQVGRTGGSAGFGPLYEGRCSSPKESETLSAKPESRVRCAAGAAGLPLPSYTPTLLEAPYPPQDVDCYDCCGFGPCHAMAALRWPTDADDNGATGGGTGSLHAPASAHPHHRPTRSDGGRDGAAGGPSSTGLSTSAARPPWRLLTGHENGQLLLWNPSHTALAPLLRIGEPGSPCRGIAAFEVGAGRSVTVLTCVE